MFVNNTIIENNDSSHDLVKQQRATLNLEYINFMNELDSEFPQPYIVKPDYYEHKQQYQSHSQQQRSFSSPKRKRMFSQIQNLSNLTNQQIFMNQKESMRDKTMEYINNQDSKAYLTFHAQKQDEKQRQQANQQNFNQIKQMLQGNNSFQTISSRPSTAMNKTPSRSPLCQPTGKNYSIKSITSYETISLQTQNSNLDEQLSVKQDNLSQCLSNIQKQKAQYIYKTAQIIEKQNNVMYMPHRHVPVTKYNNKLDHVSPAIQKQQFLENKRKNNMDKYEKQQMAKIEKERQKVLSSLAYKSVAKEKLPIKIYDNLPLSCQKKANAQLLGVNDLSPLRAKINTNNKYPMVDQRIIQQIADLEKEEQHQYIKNAEKTKKGPNKLTYEKLQEQQRTHLQNTKEIYRQMNSKSAQQYSIVHFNELK